MPNFINSPSGDLMESARLFLRHGLAVEPSLAPGVGEVARLVMRDQSIVIPYTTRRFMNQICETQFFEFRALRERAKRLIGKKQLVPIPLTFQTVFFPLRIANEGGASPRNFLWVHHRRVLRVKEIQKGTKYSKLVLTNGTSFLTPYRPAFIERQIRDSFLLEYFFQEAHDRFRPSRQHRPSLSEQSQMEAWSERFPIIAETLKRNAYKKT